MKNQTNIFCPVLFLLTVLFCAVSCERPEIKPDHSDSSDEVPVTLSSDRLVGTWVRYWDSDIKDTLRISNDGTFVYTLGDFYGSTYTKDYFYESTDNYLIDFNNPSDFRHQVHYLEFYDENTVLTLHNFSFYPGFEPSVIYSVAFKKID